MTTGMGAGTHRAARDAVAARVRDSVRAAPGSDEYRMALTTALSLPGNSLSDTGDARWGYLVWTCCVAAGGRWEQAVPVAAAVELFMIALDVLDDEEDGEGTPLRAALGPARTLNVSTGLLLLAQRGLLAAPGGAALADILLDAGVRACSGQHADLAPPLEHGHDLDVALEVAAGKSASLVAALCRLGAACAAADVDTQRLYAHFGASLGMMMQLRNDIAAVRPGALGKTDIALGRPTLPLARMAPMVVTPEMSASEADDSAALRRGQAALVAWTVAEMYRRHAEGVIPALSTDPDGRAALARLLETR